MKKLFLIPLLACISCVMAFADNVAKIGDVGYETLQAALNAADANATITLLSDAAGDITISKNVTLTGDKKITGNIEIVASEVTLTLAGVTIDVTGNDAIVHLGKTLNVVVADGTTNVINAKSSGCDCFYGINNGSLNISGNGTLNVYGYEAIHVSRLNLSAPNATYGASNTLMYDPHIVSATISAGTFDAEFPSNYVSAPLFIEKVSSSYQVSNIGANKAVYNYTAYATLQAAVDAAPAGATIVMYADDNSSVEVGKNIVIDTKGYSATGLVAASGYAKAIMGNKVAFSDNAIAAFLMADGTASLTVSEDANIASAGAIHVNGTKTLTINEGVTVTYKRQGSDGNIVVDKDAKLTVLGSGTFAPQMHSQTNTVNGFTVETSTTASNQVGNRAIDVAVGGELVVGVKDDANNCPHFITSSIARGSAVSVEGKATFNNANIQAACASIWNYGSVIINSGEYVSVATSQNGINGGWYSYNLRNDAGSNLVINDGHFVGTQGSVAVYAGATADINGGYFETVHGYNYKTGAANEKDHHYALYVATEAIVNVYNGYFKVATPSAGGGKVILSGNDDAYNTYGVINIYGGYFQRKADVQDKKNGESSYPASVPTTSQWYSSFGDEAPLPAGYEYYDTGDATYPYGVRAVAGKEADAIDPAQQAAQEANPEYTIPWQQATTWATDEVPVENTIVTIPVDATVTVSKDEAVKDAVADQVYVAQGATLKVEEGTTLTVGEGGVNIAYGGSLTVKPGAMVKIGAAGVITAEEEALVLESTEDAQAILLYDPAVAENTQPKATVRLYTNSKQISASPWNYVYQRIAIPVKDPVVPETDFAEATHGFFPGEEAYGFESYLFYWTGHAWANTSWASVEPFKGYQLANNSLNGGVTYSFTGNLIGNQDGEYPFEESGFDYFGNSYTAPIHTETFLDGLKANYPNMEATIWLYNYSNNIWEAIALEDIADGFVGADYLQVKSMDGFLLNLHNGTNGSAGVDYSSAIWGNPLLPGAAPAPARRQSAQADNSVVINVKGTDGMGDKLTLVEKAGYSADFENGADATKYIYADHANLYATTANGEQSRVATNNLANTAIAFTSTQATEYTLQFSHVAGSDYLLRDVLTGALIRMEEGAEYTFTQAANTTVPVRFQVVAVRPVATDIDNMSADAPVMQKVLLNGQLYILRDSKWFNVQGQAVK